MRISCISSDSITITAGEGDNLKAFEAALLSHRWVRMNEDGELESCNAHKPPKVADPEIEAIWGEPAQTQLFPPSLHVKKDADKAIYIQHIQGYTGNYRRIVIIVQLSIILTHEWLHSY